MAGKLTEVTSGLTKPRRKALIALGLVFIAVLLLSISVSEVRFQPGQPFPFGGGFRMDSAQGGDLPVGDSLFLVIRVAYLIGMALLPVFIIYLIISPTARKQFFRDFLRILPVILMFYLMARFLQTVSKPAEGELGINTGTSPGEAPPALDMPEFAANPPEWIVLGSSICLVLVPIILFALGIVLIVRRRREPRTVLKRIGEEAQLALDELQAGGNLRNTVIRCYYEMSRVLHEQRGIQRDQGMTPREFEDALVQRGLPAQPIQQLTRVFEEVRYGDKEPGEREERMAITSLAAIVEACKGTDENI